jgi:Heterokaryon incompatibility protein (HET)
MMVTSRTSQDSKVAPKLYASLPLLAGSRCIRVLDVVRLSENDSYPLQCDLRIIDLDSEPRPSFTALSYAWGAQTLDSSVITCGSFTLPITRNCHSALQQLTEVFGKLTIWIDAICINQDDEDEKMQQILLMQDIYSRAETVYIWLGEGNVSTDRAMGYLKNAGHLEHFFLHGDPTKGRLSNPAIWAAAWSAYTARWVCNSHLFPSMEQGKSSQYTRTEEIWVSLNRLLRVFAFPSRKATNTKTTAEDLEELLTRDWINRIWTFQEIVLAFNPVIVCGNRYLSWCRFAIGINFLHYSGINYNNGEPIIENLDAWTDVSSGRDYVTACSGIHKGLPDLNRSSKTTLQLYKRFLINVGQIMVRIHVFLFYLYMCFGFLTPIILISWLALRREFGTSEQQETIPTSVIDAAAKVTSSAVVCAVTCASDSIQACYKACEDAQGAAITVNNLISSLQGKVLYTEFDRGFGVPFAISFTLALVPFVLSLGFPGKSYLLRGLALHNGSPKVNLVETLCYRKSKDKRDKVFGVQSILQELSCFRLRSIDSAAPLEQIYKQLCIQLMEVTGTLQFLLPATTNHFPGHPTWVPNWAADFDTFWLKPTLFRNKGLHATPGSVGHWTLDPYNSDVLVVRGRQICSVKSCSTFRETWNTYDPKQRSLHLKNLRTMFAFWDIFYSQEATLWMKLEERSGFGLMRCIDQSAFDSWKMFLKIHHNEDPRNVLDLLEHGTDSSLQKKRPLFNRGGASLQEIFRAHISMCNILARTEKVIFQGNSAIMEKPQIQINLETMFPIGEDNEGSTWKRFEIKGICTRNVHVGDMVVLVAGVSSPLIIRRGHTSMSLVSPAIISGAMEGEFWDSSWRSEELDRIYLC